MALSDIVNLLGRAGSTVSNLTAPLRESQFGQDILSQEFLHPIGAGLGVPLALFPFIHAFLPRRLRPRALAQGFGLGVGLMSDVIGERQRLLRELLDRGELTTTAPASIVDVSGLQWQTGGEPAVEIPRVPAPLAPLPRVQPEPVGRLLGLGKVYRVPQVSVGQLFPGAPAVLQDRPLTRENVEIYGLQRAEQERIADRAYKERVVHDAFPETRNQTLSTPALDELFDRAMWPQRLQEVMTFGKSMGGGEAGLSLGVDVQGRPTFTATVPSLMEKETAEFNRKQMEAMAEWRQSQAKKAELENAQVTLQANLQEMNSLRDGIGQRNALLAANVADPVYKERLQQANAADAKRLEDLTTESNILRRRLQAEVSGLPTWEEPAPKTKEQLNAEKIVNAASTLAPTLAAGWSIGVALGRHPAMRQYQGSPFWPEIEQEAHRQAQIRIDDLKQMLREGMSQEDILYPQGESGPPGPYQEAEIQRARKLLDEEQGGNLLWRFLRSLPASTPLGSGPAIP